VAEEAADQGAVGDPRGRAENAGVIDIGDGPKPPSSSGSHNHPSYIEPYQGAATGVGGIMRDVFTMGARPVANLNALALRDPQASKTPASRVGRVAGIGGYGNCNGHPDRRRRDQLPCRLQRQHPRQMP